MRTETVPQSDDIAYRDYLVGVVCESVTKPRDTPAITEFGPPPPTAVQLWATTLQDLKKRFKQGFGTQDNAVIGVNRVAIEVVQAVMVDDLGFGAAALPAQGAQEDRTYLDQLITASGATEQWLSTTYRTDLSRLDYDETTRVRENIRTLQAYLRDDKLAIGYNPFFLYKDEWRLRFRTAFFPENHYAFRRGLFADSADRSKATALMAAVKAHKDFKATSGHAGEFLTRLEALLTLDSDLMEGHRQFAAEEYGLARDAYQKAGKDLRAVAQQLTYKAWALPDDGSTFREIRVTPGLGSPTAFRNSFNPKNAPEAADMTWFFGRMPDGFGGQFWGPYDMGGVHHDGLWVEGKASGSWDPFDIPTKVPPHCPFTQALFQRFKARYDARATVKVDSLQALKTLESLNVADPSVWTYDASATLFSDLEAALFELHDDLVSLVPHVAFLLLPVCLGDVAVELGDYPEAARQYSASVTEQLFRGSLLTATPSLNVPPEAEGDLPWTSVESTSYVPVARVGATYTYLNQACEVAFLKLRCGGLYLTWADALYRSDREPEVFRARELYRALLSQYGIDPAPGAGLAPLARVHKAVRPGAAMDRLGTLRRSEAALVPATGIGEMASQVRKDAIEVAWAPLIKAGLEPVEFAKPESDLGGAFLVGTFVAVVITLVNPAILAQQMRARMGVTQIDAGTNFFGYGDNLVPVLRYRPLAEGARYFAALAKQAQTDFLSYKASAEREELALMAARLTVVASAVRVEIESQRIIQAEDYLAQTKIQVQQVQDAIKAKKDEIADHNSLCGQMKDFFSGLAGFLGAVPGEAMGFVKSGFSAAFKGGEAAAGASAGLGVVGGIALVSIGAAYTMSGMADAANTRVSELGKLQTQQLPIALAGQEARACDLAIAEMQKSVAKLEAQYAQEVLRYLELRTLSSDLWIQMAAFMKAALRRHLDLGATVAWLAERALSYSQDRDVRLIRFDYYQPKLAGLLGADALQTDLAALEKEYLAGFQHTVPIAWTVSLARDYPLAFAQLKTHGRCAFMTLTADLDRAYPGTYGHRIRTVEVAAVVPVTDAPPRGCLTSPGISRVEGETLGDFHTHVRPPDALPLSSFSLRNDLAVYSLPGDALMCFEGSGMDTLWTIELPAAANPKGLVTLADLTITFHLEALFSAGRAAALAARPPETLRRSALFSASHLFADSLKAFRAGGDPAELVINIDASLLPAAETNRTVTNVAVCFIGSALPVVKARLSSESVPAGATFTTSAGFAHSNLLPAPATAPAVPAALNPLAAGAPDQKWTLTVRAGHNPNLDLRGIDDVLLGIEYSTQPAYVAAATM